MKRMSVILLVLAGGVLSAGQSTAAAVLDAKAARKVPPLDLSDPKKVPKQLDAMSADELVRYLTNPRDPQFSWVMGALRRKGDVAIPHLVKLMERNDLGFSEWASPTRVLLDIGDKSLPPLIELLKGDNQTARRNAAWALKRRNKPCKDAIAPLIEVLKGKDEGAAGYAAAALIPNGKDAADAVPHLIPLAFKMAARSAAPRLAIEAIGLDPKLIPMVIQHLAVKESEPESEALRLWAGARLLAIAGKDGAAALAEALGHTNRTVRQGAAQAIQRIGKPTRTDAVEKALNAAIADDVTRIDAAAALVAIGASAKAAVPGLIKDLESGRMIPLHSRAYRYECRAAEVLALIPEALPALIEGLGSDKKMVPTGCALAILDDKATAKQVSLKLKELLARSTSQQESKLIVRKLNLMERAASRDKGSRGGFYWPKMMREMLASAKAEVNKAARSAKVPAEPPAGQGQIVKANNQFATDLYGRIAGEKGNLFFSPSSIHTALAMTYAGARGSTAAEMAKTLHYGKGEKFFSAYGRVVEQTKATKDSDYQLNIANALWLQQDKPFLAPFLKLNTDHFKAGLFDLDFKRAFEPARRKINKWVEDKTKEKIKDLLPAGSLNAATRMVLTNAIYFKGDWATQFKTKNTKDMDFHVSAGKKVKTPMMYQPARIGYTETPDMQVLKMPYEGDDLSMVVLLPKKQAGIARLEKSLTAGNIDLWVKRLGRPHTVKVYFPRFKMTCKMKMKPILSKMGMPAAFGGGADFSGMTGSRGLFIDEVYHKAFVKVDEKGTEAAAATAVVVKKNGGSGPVVFKADHPFVFLIRHEKTGMILFLGRVSEPKE